MQDLKALEGKSLVELREIAKAIGNRDEIECSFGTAKRIYRANDIRLSFRTQHDAGRECATSSRT